MSDSQQFEVQKVSGAFQVSQGRSIGLKASSLF